MTFKRICNRCGKDIGEGIQDEDNELHFTKKRNTAFGYDNCMHLCNDCLKEFDQFMKKKITFQGNFEDN